MSIRFRTAIALFILSAELFASSGNLGRRLLYIRNESVAGAKVATIEVTDSPDFERKVGGSFGASLIRAEMIREIDSSWSGFEKNEWFVYPYDETETIMIENMTRLAEILPASISRDVMRIDLSIKADQQQRWREEWDDVRISSIAEDHVEILVRPSGTVDFRRLSPSLVTYVWGARFNRYYSAGEKLDGIDLTRTLVAGTNSQIPSQPQWYQTSVAVPTGTILKDSMIVKSELVRAGDEITLVVIKGTVAVEMDGTALESGGYDDRIGARLHLSGKRVEGFVGGVRSVHVELP